MKAIMKLALGALFATTALTSCKDNKAETEVETTTETTEMEMETTDTATVVNDTNVSGTTSGEMEQVP